MIVCCKIGHGKNCVFFGVRGLCRLLGVSVSDAVCAKLTVKSVCCILLYIEVDVGMNLNYTVGKNVFIVFLFGYFLRSRIGCGIGGRIGIGIGIGIIVIKVIILRIVADHTVVFTVIILLLYEEEEREDEHCNEYCYKDQVRAALNLLIRRIVRRLINGLFLVGSIIIGRSIRGLIRGIARLLGLHYGSVGYFSYCVK